MKHRGQTVIVLIVLTTVFLFGCQSIPIVTKQAPVVASPHYYQERLKAVGIDASTLACNSDNWWLDTLKDESALSADLLQAKLHAASLLDDNQSPADTYDIINKHMMSWIVRSGLILRGGHNFGAILLKDRFWIDSAGKRRSLVIFRSAYTADPGGSGSCFQSLLENAGVKHVVNIYGDDFIYVEDLDVAEKEAAKKAGVTYALTDKMGYGPWRHTIARHPEPGPERDVAMRSVARLINEQILKPGGQPPRGNILIHCGGGMHRTGIVIGVLQRVINQMPMEDIAAEYRYHVSYKSEEQPGGFEQGNLDFIRDFDPNLIVR